MGQWRPNGKVRHEDSDAVDACQVVTSSVQYRVYEQECHTHGRKEDAVQRYRQYFLACCGSMRWRY